MRTAWVFEGGIDQVKRAVAFHHLEGDKVAVRIAFSYASEMCRGRKFVVGVLLPIPAALKPALERAEKHEQGLPHEGREGRPRAIRELLVAAPQAEEALNASAQAQASAPPPVERIDERLVTRLDDLAADLQAGRELPRGEREVLREHREALDGLEARQGGVHLALDGLLQVLAQTRLGGQGLRSSGQPCSRARARARSASRVSRATR